MLHILLLGLIIGWGVAMPLGPINIEIMRRNLHYGVRYGLAIGVGATFADICYLLLLTTGAIQLLHHSTILRIISIAGSLVLMWFAYRIFSSTIEQPTEKSLKPYTLWHSISSGFIVAFLSPFNLLFWASLTSQITTITQGDSNNIIIVGVGIIIGAMAWVSTLNSILFFTRHKLSPKVIRILNNLGGVALFGFAIYGMIHAL